jgi:hypothetical protein
LLISQYPMEHHLQKEKLSSSMAMANHSPAKQGGQSLPAIPVLQQKKDDEKPELTQDLVPGTGSGDNIFAPGQQAQAPIQRAAVDTNSGTFTDETYTLARRKVTASIKFRPNDKVEATKIGMIQSIKSTKDGAQAFKEPAMEARVSDEGSNIDRLADKNNPVYGAASLGDGDDLDASAETNGATYKLGFRKAAGPAWQVQDAELQDAPTVGNLGNNGGKVFETTALILEGEDKGAYLGSVSWGATSDGSGVISKLPFAKASDGEPTSSFMKAAAAWNTSKARGTMVVKNDATPTVGGVITLTKDTELTWLANTGSGGRSYVRGRITTGPNTGTEVEVDVSYVKDKGDGADHKALPDADPTRIRDFKATIKKMKTALDADNSLNEGKPVPDDLRTNMQQEYGELKKVWKTISSASKDKIKATTAITVIDQYYVKVCRSRPSQSVMWSNFDL